MLVKEWIQFNIKVDTPISVHLFLFAHIRDSIQKARGSKMQQIVLVINIIFEN